jgi:hypothetical protein
LDAGGNCGVNGLNFWLVVLSAVAQLLDVGHLRIMKISARDIRVLVAGALALDGFAALIAIPYYSTLSTDSGHIGRAIVSGLFVGLALPIGIGIFLRRWSAMLWAQIYLWLKFISGCMVIPYFLYFSHAKIGFVSLILRSAPEVLVAAILLALMFWATSEKFRYEPDA